MAEEPRRSGRATKGQHKNASSSPAPQPQPPSQAKPASTNAPKMSKSQREDKGEEEEEEEEVVRCICGKDAQNRAYVSCDTCEVWQHCICMGEPEAEEDLPEHYYCEQCAPEQHAETVQALERGEKIWETRNKIAQNEKKMGKNRKSANRGPPGWLKKPTTPHQDGETQPEAVKAESHEAGSKRKRDEVKEEPPADEKPAQPARQDKRRKSAAPDAETAIVEISTLPSERQRTATALSKIIADEINVRVKAGAHKLAEGETVKAMGDSLASLIEYELTMNYGDAPNPQYTGHFRTLHANLKRNKALVERLLDGSLTAAELATMSSQDMASEEQQKQRAQLKEQLDRQAVAIEQTEGPKYRRTHKGDELIEDENQQQSAQVAPPVQPVRERTSIAEGEDANGSPTNPDARSPVQPPSKIDTSRPSDVGPPRRQSSQQFDMSSIWAKTAQSPTSATQPRPMQMPPRRRSSIKPTPEQQGSGTKEDADVDRMLQDDDYDTYLPNGVSLGPNQVVWRGKLIQTADSTEPRVSARFVAGRDVSSTVSWPDLLGNQLSIDGRLSTTKAEEYLLSLEWSSTVDISVLALSPLDDDGAFHTVFDYFKSRERYAVVNKDKPTMVRDLYIIPLEVGADLPQHVVAMEYSSFKKPVEKRLLLATFVVNRAPEKPAVADQAGAADARQQQQQSQQPAQTPGANGTGNHLPVHMRGAPGPAGSPLNAGQATFSPTHHPGQHAQMPTAGYGMPPNPYAPQQQHPPPDAYHQAAPPNPLANEILGGLQHAPSAQAILAAQPDANRQQLEHLRRILEEDPATRTDLEALSKRLFQEDAGAV